MELVTGKKGQVHITSADVGALYAEILGTGNYVLSGGDKFDATLINQNTVRIQSGEALMNGRHCRIRYGQYEDVTIESGTIGYRRFDIIGIEYTVSNGIESAELAVIKGTPYTGDIDESHIPSYTEGNILQGDTYAFFPLHLIAYDGLTPAVDRDMFNELYKPITEWIQEIVEADEEEFDDIRQNIRDYLISQEVAQIAWDNTLVSSTSGNVRRRGYWFLFKNTRIAFKSPLTVNTKYTIGTFDTSGFERPIKNLNLRMPLYDTNGAVVGSITFTTTTSGTGTIEVYLISSKSVVEANGMDMIW